MGPGITTPCWGGSSRRTRSCRSWEERRPAAREYRTNARITRRAICGRPPQPAARVRQATATEVTRLIGPHYEVVVSVASGQVLTTAG